MNEMQEWETPEFTALTDSDARADQVDIPVRNGMFAQASLSA
jgi:hypothetical protein